MNGLRKRKKLKVVNFLRLRKPFIHPILILFTHVKPVQFTPLRT